jgi:molybdopterin-containing oxidoreductase family iron-sulfur binding subunit
MGASLALGGLTGCRWPREEILPFTNRPVGRTPGLPSHHATCLEVGGVARPVVATSWAGRPTKLEGNELHPESLGATDAVTQGHLLDLYDPHRQQQVLHAGEVTDWAAFQSSVLQPLRDDPDRRLAVLAEASSSRALAGLRQRLEQARGDACQWYEFEAASRDHEREGLRLVLGGPYRSTLDLREARVVLSLDADLLGDHPTAVRNARQLANARRGHDLATGNPVELQPCRLYVVESSLSLLGGLADWRRARPIREVCLLACHLARHLQELAPQLPWPRGLEALLRQATAAPLEEPGLSQLAHELLGHRGAAVVVAGYHLPPELHALVALLNHALGNVDHTVRYLAEPERPTHVAAVADLARSLAAGQVDTLLVLGGDPCQDAPADVELARHLARAGVSAHLTLHLNATSTRCDWVLPRCHSLEAWGDASSHEGTRGVVQPLIAPLHPETRSPIEVLSILADDEPRAGHAIVREAMRPLLPDDPAWRRALHDGLLQPGSLPASPPRSAGAEELSGLLPYLQQPAAGTVEVVLRPDPKLHDGRFAGNVWLQELPDPMTRVVWDNAAVLAPATAQALGVDTGDVLELRRGQRRLEIAACVLPGHAPGVISLNLGYGRQEHPVADGAGVDVTPLRTTDAWTVVPGVQVTRTGRRYPLATAQAQLPGGGRLHAADGVGEWGTAVRLPELAREATLAELQADPHCLQRHHDREPPRSLWVEPNAPGQVREPLRPPEHRWALVVDLSACSGCSTCVLACVAENNIPMVGKEEVGYGREMHWLRIDRYFLGDPAAPRVIHQPVPCMQCETAPCEEVCPVAATVHDVEGLNDMVYNRCIGTRYCQNNCPYKVRHFNHWNNHLHRSELEQLVFQPDVTVRGRGVMEKCTYCVQRIARVHIQAQNRHFQGRDDGGDAKVRAARLAAYRAEIRTIVPACAQACPSRAILFGDLDDPDSPVARLREDPRSYALLGELNTKPRTRYLGRLRNPPRGG